MKLGSIGCNFVFWQIYLYILIIAQGCFQILDEVQ